MDFLTGTTTDQAPADPSATDDMLASQPIGYWSDQAHAVVTRHLRNAMAGIDVTQPQYWVLNSVKYWPAAPSRDEIAAQLLPLADGQHEIPRVVAQLLHRGWLRTDARHRLYLTDAGEAARMRLRELVTELRAVVHDGISDEEYVAALKVLRRMISNVESARNPKVVQVPSVTSDLDTLLTALYVKIDGEIGDTRWLGRPPQPPRAYGERGPCPARSAYAVPCPERTRP